MYRVPHDAGQFGQAAVQMFEIVIRFSATPPDVQCGLPGRPKVLACSKEVELSFIRNCMAQTLAVAVFGTASTLAGCYLLAGLDEKRPGEVTLVSLEDEGGTRAKLWFSAITPGNFDASPIADVVHEQGLGKMGSNFWGPNFSLRPKADTGKVGSIAVSIWGKPASGRTYTVRRVGKDDPPGTANVQFDQSTATNGWRWHATSGTVEVDDLEDDRIDLNLDLMFEPDDSPDTVAEARSTGTFKLRGTIVARVPR